MQHKLNAPAQTVLDLLTNAKWLEARCLALGDISASVKTKKKAGQITVTMHRRISRELPGMLAKVLPPESDMVLEETWTLGDKGDPAVMVGFASTVFGEESAHVSAEGNGGGDGAVLHGAIPPGLIYGDHVMGPCEDLRAHVVGDAEKSGDDHDGDRFGKGRDQIGGSLRGELVD